MGAKRLIGTLLLATALTACGGGGSEEEQETKSAGVAELPPTDPYPSTYQPLPSETTVFRVGTVYDGLGGVMTDAVVVVADGKIAAIGAADEVDVPRGAVEVDAQDKVLTPGIIDNHSHLGVYPSPGFRSTSDGNERTSPNTADVWAEHSVWPQDPGFSRALAGGVTSLQILPGSANLFGGRAVTLKNVPSRTVQGMKFPDAPYGMKMACGENPKRVYSSRGPSTRMGNMRGYREGWIDAQDYARKWKKYEAKIEKGEDADPPKRDLKLETLAAALNGDILVNMHCYRADEMVQIIDLSREFGYKITAFHHSVESYKIADILAAEDICSSVWADWWGFKLEAYDAVRENAALIEAAGACTIIHSDSEIGIQRLNQEAAKAMADGNQIGLGISKATAMTWITSNPAKAMGIGDQTGSLEPGKMADLVLWDGDPFSVYSKAERVYIDGALIFDRENPDINPRSDYELGQRGLGPTGGAGQ